MSDSTAHRGGADSSGSLVMTLAARRRVVAMFAAAAGGAALLALLLWHMPLVADENVHSYQVQLFLWGRHVIHPKITRFPAYEALLAVVSVVTGTRSVHLLRAVNLAVAAAVVALARGVARELARQRAEARALEVYFCPILFPLFFLLYTDPLSLALVLAGLWAVLRGRLTTASLASLASVLVRQTNVVWVVYAIAVALERAGWPLPADPRARAVARWLPPDPARYAGLALVVVAFGVFVLVNRGVAVGDRAHHPITFSTGNISVFLFLHFWLALPVNVAILRRESAWLRSRGAVLSLAAAALVLLVTFRADHEYNRAALEANLRDPAAFMAYPETARWPAIGKIGFLRNHLLAALTTWPRKLLLVVPAVGSFAVLLRTRFALPRAPLLVAIASALAPAWLVEQRYAIVPLALVTLLRAPESPRIEAATVGLAAALSFVAAACIAAKLFFL